MINLGPPINNIQGYSGFFQSYSDLKVNSGLRFFSRNPLKIRIFPRDGNTDLSPPPAPNLVMETFVESFYQDIAKTGLRAVLTIYALPSSVSCFQIFPTATRA